MKKIVQAVAITGAMMMGTFAQANAIEDFSGCLVEKTTGADHLALIKWMYVGMSGHPSLSAMNNVTDSEKKEANQTMGILFDRLLGKDCAAEFKVVFQQHGQVGIQSAFSVLGEVAMAEMMQNADVMNDLMLFTNYIDVDAFEKMLQE
ncbi:hypothetical protein MMG00_03635 [Ignatzschineria rhizosphaerae]|uniref:Uncharacterized protein n=1 Tax=Ignatzschineria rhizosphaerae TaxID=2923279 RepID=A0ABY3X4Y1_9GAMM|nr:hypothetical protein [Ignatzschineria rhizosphaerae]UNM96955.1 hypothetical protein MMG00_03635 [Ignatzschineria rhizosphaerae]